MLKMLCIRSLLCSEKNESIIEGAPPNCRFDFIRILNRTSGGKCAVPVYSIVHPVLCIDIKGMKYIYACILPNNQEALC